MGYFRSLGTAESVLEHFVATDVDPTVVDPNPGIRQSVAMPPDHIRFTPAPQKSFWDTVFMNPVSTAPHGVRGPVQATNYTPLIIGAIVLGGVLLLARRQG